MKNKMLNFIPQLKELHRTLLGQIKKGNLAYIDIHAGILQNLKKSKKLTIDYIKKVVCDYYNISVDDIEKETRKRKIVEPRQVCHYISKKNTRKSLQYIGMKIGGKDHATVLHSCKTVNNLLDSNKLFREKIKEIESVID